MRVGEGAGEGGENQQTKTTKNRTKDRQMSWSNVFFTRPPLLSLSPSLPLHRLAARLLRLNISWHSCHCQFVVTQKDKKKRRRKLGRIADNSSNHNNSTTTNIAQRHKPTQSEPSQQQQVQPVYCWRFSLSLRVSFLHPTSALFSCHHNPHLGAHFVEQATTKRLQKNKTESPKPEP